MNVVEDSIGSITDMKEHSKEMNHKDFVQKKKLVKVENNKD